MGNSYKCGVYALNDAHPYSHITQIMKIIIEIVIASHATHIVNQVNYKFIKPQNAWPQNGPTLHVI
jgi:hypothetical protein